MNILIYHGDETCPTMGGVQRTTSLVAEGLKERYGHKIYNIYNYSKPYSPEIPRYKYELSYRLKEDFSPSDVAKIIKEHKIKAIINQMGVRVNSIFKKAIEESGEECKLYYFHHTTPNRLWDLSFSGALRRFKKTPSFKQKVKEAIKITTFPLFKAYSKYSTLKKNAKDYIDIYIEANKFVLLSRFFQDEWKNLTGIKDLSKLYAIPNARSFDITADANMIRNKQKRILIVSRMVEFPKQVLIALKIWKEIIKDNEFSDWKFDIVGTGPDLEEYKSYAKIHGIKNVIFHGRQESLQFYEKASIYLLPSIREGWPMTLMESMQMGVVPIAFDSFGSVREIIQDGETGFLIKPFDKKAYSNRLKLLMKDKTLRESMALKAVASTERFTKDKVLNMWQHLLTDNNP